MYQKIKDDDILKSEDYDGFNMGLQRVTLVSLYLFRSDMARINLNASECFQFLVSCYVNLTHKMKKELRQELRDRIDKLGFKIQHFNKLKQKGINKVPKDLFDDLLDFQVILNDIADKSGLLDKQYKNPANALGR